MKYRGEGMENGRKESSGENPVKVSVIMPVLNTAKYIRECMDSLISQTLKEIEILCVDGGSTDGTREILTEYADRDSRVHILEDTKGSTGYANNLGMRMSRGEYLAIVEPDDFVAADMYERLYEAAKEVQADVVRADYRIFFGEGEGREFIDKAIAAASDYGKVYCPAVAQRLFRNDMSSWAGIFARELFDGGRVCHNETPGAAYQDNGFWFLLMAQAKRLYYLPLSGYRYRMDNPGSSVHNRSKVYAICDEYAFIRKRLEQEGIFETFAETYVWVKFIRYLSAYYRLDDKLKPLLAERFAVEMQKDLQGRKSAGDGRDREASALSENDIPPTGFSGTEHYDPRDFSGGQKKLLAELLQGGEVFHAKRMREKESFHRLAQSGRKLILFGCGSDGIRMLNYMKAEGCLDRLACLCDSNPQLSGSVLFGKEVLCPDKVRDRYPDAVYLLTSVNYGDEIQEKLTGAGVSREDIWGGSFC